MIVSPESICDDDRRATSSAAYRPAIRVSSRDGIGREAYMTFFNEAPFIRLIMSIPRSGMPGEMVENKPYV